MRAHGCTWGIFYEVEIRWHLIDRHGLHGYLGDRVVGRHILQPGAVRPFLREIFKKKIKRKKVCGGVEIKGFPLHFIYLHLPQIRENVGCASLLHCHPLTWLEEEQSRLVFLSAWHRHKSEPHLWKKLPFPLLIL